MESVVHKYSCTVVNVFGCLGNILVILSILKQKKNMLKNNYYFLVLHLAICDLAVLIYLLDTGELYWLEKPLSTFQMWRCHIDVVADAFVLAGVCMMLIISLLRYRATVHPLKPSISRRKLKVVCGLMYLVGLIVAFGIELPMCNIKSNVVLYAYRKFYFAFWTFFAVFVPTIFMAVVYCRIARSLIKQNKHMKRVCSNAMRRSAPDSTFNISRYIRNRRTFFVCLGTVLCYGIGHIPLSVWYIWDIAGENHLQMKFGWIRYFAYLLIVSGSHSSNPLIYGILDKKLLTFWKCPCKKKRRNTSELENCCMYCSLKDENSS